MGRVKTIGEYGRRLTLRLRGEALSGLGVLLTVAHGTCWPAQTHVSTAERGLGDGSCNALRTSHTDASFKWLRCFMLHGFKSLSFVHETGEHKRSWELANMYVICDPSNDSRIC